MTKTKITKDHRDFYAKPLPRDERPLREQVRATYRPGREGWRPTVDSKGCR